MDSTILERLRRLEEQQTQPPVVPEGPDEADEPNRELLEQLHKVYFHAKERNWGNYTPCGPLKDPNELIIRSHAEYVAVCEIRYMRILERERKIEAKKARIAKKFDTLGKKATQEKLDSRSASKKSLKH